MDENNARNIIEQDLKEKLLGPGYAKDVIECAEDCYDEIIPELPRNAYRVGIIAPAGIVPNPAAEEENNGEELNQDEVMPDDAQVDGEIDVAEETNEARHLSERVGDQDDSDTTTDSSSNRMAAHIGLIVCVPENNETVDVEISYGTYEALTWRRKVDEVRVKIGEFADTIEAAIDEFNQNERTIASLNNVGVESLRNIIILNNDNHTIALSSDWKETEIRNIFLPDYNNTQYYVEAELIKILFSNCYKRTHHAHNRTIDCRIPNQTITFDDDANVELRVDSYVVNNKRFLSVILKSVANEYIYQPRVLVNGELLSYTEPISTIADDQENAINEFLYRNVMNYGKGINCAVNWNAEATQIFTDFTPTTDVEKFTNRPRNANEAITAACTLRNLSIWSEIDIIEVLNQFVVGYQYWHDGQIAEANNIDGFNNEKATILENQETFLTRLHENVDYLRDNADALQCFKIANTAMLMQMVVARHPLFKKNRDAENYDDEPDIYDNLEFFHNGQYNENFGEPSYYPFQLAFLLMNVKPTFDLADPNRNLVDLIWFPTGGGKTEAYLALTALTIVARRHRVQDSGVSVIMRYTLRLLTNQQFERATYLICALEFLRNKSIEQNLGLQLGNQRISIGLYVGSNVTPNNAADLGQFPYNRYFQNQNNNRRNNNRRNGNHQNNGFELRNDNPFPITYCPWCGTRLVSPDGVNHGYERNGNVFCINNHCSFRENRDNLPLSYTDDCIYNQNPTLLFATVDKFAQLYRGANSQLICPDGQIDTPDLIIQDELHLLVGALGSIVGFYESIIEKLCSNNGRTPKIIAATATTRNTSELISKLYNRQAAVFPPQGLEYSDNYFSYVDQNNSNRRHMGLISAECVTSNMTEIRLTSILTLSKVKVFKRYIADMHLNWRNPDDVIQACSENQLLARVLDDYWCTVLYFNSLKDLGRSRSRVSQEVFESVRSHQYLYTIPPALSFLRAKNGFDRRVLEFTSRIDSSRIKSMLTQAETPVRLNIDGQNIRVANDSVDLVFASNMISVGIDIRRWNLLVMVGQPRSTSEYIQSSSRAARTTYGLVLNLMNPRRIREHSLFENYIPFHRTFYKGVEPLSITPLTAATIKHKVLLNIAKIYRSRFANGQVDAEDIADSLYQNLFEQRFGLQRGQLVNELLDEITNRVQTVINDNNLNQEAAQSLREIASDSYISIDGIN